LSKVQVKKLTGKEKGRLAKTEGAELTVIKTEVQLFTNSISQEVTLSRNTPKIRQVWDTAIGQKRTMVRNLGKVKESAT
jgi:hypothetical protein